MTGKLSAGLLAVKLRVGVLTPDENTLASDMLRRIPELEADYKRLMDKHSALYIELMSDRKKIERLEAEIDEQARLNGMGAERELALMAKVEKARANSDRWEWIADGSNFDESVALLTDPALTAELLTRAVDAAIANARKDTL